MAYTFKGTNAAPNQPITSDGTYYICDTAAGNPNLGFLAFLAVTQVGTGTWKWQISWDGGTTIVDLKEGGVNITGASSGGARTQLPLGAFHNRLRLYLQVTGSSGLSLLPVVVA